METIETSQDGFYIAPRARCYVAERLGDEWEEVPYLYLHTLKITAAPDVDEARLMYDYGRILREDQTAPDTYPKLELLGKFLKIEIDDDGKSDRIETVKEVGKPRYVVAIDGVQPITWYGVIETEELDVHGSADEIPRGRQFVTVFGLLRLFERLFIHKSLVADATLGTLEIGYGLPFNVQQRTVRPGRGNRETAKTEGREHYIFAADDRTSAVEVWTARDAVDYLLAVHPPVDKEGVPIAPAVLVAEDNVLDWYDVTVETDGRSVKAVLDELLNRRRGVGYYAVYDEEEDELQLRAFSFLEESIQLDSSVEMGANTNQKRLNFERAADIEAASLRATLATRYDRVTVIGDFETATATFRFTEPDDEFPQLIPDWADTEEIAYKAGASEESGFDALDVAAQERANVVARSADLYRHVYSRFRIAPDWDGTVPAAAGSDRYWLFPPRDAQGDPIQPKNTNDTPGVIWNRGVRIDDATQFRFGLDYNGTHIQDGTVEAYYDIGDAGLSEEPERAFLPLFVFLPTGETEGSPSGWQLIDQLSAIVSQEGELRRWSGHVRSLDRGPLLEIRVSGGPQHFLAATDFAADPAGSIVNERDDPAKQYGLDWQDARATLTIKLPQRVSASADSLDAREELPKTQLRELFIPLRDARLDYVVPDTVWAVHQGDLLLANSGGFLRDDRTRMKLIAAAAAQWYGRERQAITLRFKQIRDFVSVGDLIVDIGETYNREIIRTPVTSITYDFSGDVPKTTLETNYADLDFT